MFLLNWIFALPKILEILVSTIAPTIRKVLEWAAVYVEVMWEGFKDVLDNWKTILFVATLSGFIGFSVRHHYVSNPKCSKVISDLRKDYKFVPRVKTKDTSSHPQSEWWKVFN